MRVVTVDAPPSPAIEVPTVHYVPYETDAYAKASARAFEEIGRRYGDKAVTYLEATKSLTLQFLNASRK